MTSTPGIGPSLSASVLAKVKRGIKHTDELMQIIAAWAHTNTHLIHHTYADKTTFKIDLRISEAPPAEEWGAIFGDAIHNFRSALDVWMWETAEAQTSVALKANDVYFPITASGDAWRKWKSKMKQYVDQYTIAGLHTVQPSANQWRPLSENALYGLHQLDIADKHRLIHKIQLLPHSIADITFDLDEPRGPGNDVHAEAFAVSATDGGTIAVLIFDKPPRSVDLSEDFTWDAAFTTDAGYHHAHNTLTTFAEGVQKMIRVAELKAEQLRTAAST
ncbi:hypothetical protein [Rhodococcus opacus]|uniref:hypothetical protein n=1 Tax=Rhodococcus opacus TaxID=37919 RepID=UPI0034D1B825